MDWFLKNQVCELDFAENNLVQALLSKFTLTRNGHGAMLDVHFDGKTPTIRRRESKALIKKSIPNFTQKALKYQDYLDAILIEQNVDELPFDDPQFVFRYASGGVLPILIFGEKEYFCLFYRDVEPIGWNIANGGCDSLEELLNPVYTINRELQEELLIFDFEKEQEHRFAYHSGCSLDLVEFETARRLWQMRFPNKIFANFTPLKPDIQWLNGPDRLSVTYGTSESRSVSDCFVNVNALDFGIEIDKIARIAVKEHFVLLDGELINNVLLGSAMGLFEVNRFRRQPINWEQDFLPDSFYYDGARRIRDFEGTIEKYWDRLLSNNIRDRRGKAIWGEEKHKYKLCPVTKALIRRYIARQTSIQDEYDVYICYSSVDRPAVEKILNDMESNGIKCWYDQKEITPVDRIIKELERGMQKSRSMLLCISKDFLQSKWADIEYITFLHIKYGQVAVLRLENVEVPLILQPIKRVDLWNEQEYRKLIEYFRQHRLGHFVR